MTAQPYGQPEEPQPEETQKREVPPRPAFAPVAAPAYREMAVRWGPVFAGVLIALALNLVLDTLGAAVGFSAARPTGANVGNVLLGAAIWSGAALLIAVFIGGYLAGRLGTYLGLRRGALQGTVVWAIYLLVMVWISTGGLASAFGAMNFNLAAGGAAPSTAGIARALGTASTTTWVLFGAMAVSWVLAMLGGILGVSSLESAEPVPAPRPVR